MDSTHTSDLSRSEYRSYLTVFKSSTWNVYSALKKRFSNKYVGCGDADVTLSLHPICCTSVRLSSGGTLLYNSPKPLVSGKKSLIGHDFLTK